MASLSPSWPARIGDAFSGQVEHPQSQLSFDRHGTAPPQARIKSSDKARAVRAVETASAVRNLTCGKPASVAEIGPWTTSENAANHGPEPQGQAGVALRIDLPAAVDLDWARPRECRRIGRPFAGRCRGRRECRGGREVGRRVLRSGNRRDRVRPAGAERPATNSKWCEATA